MRRWGVPVAETTDEIAESLVQHIRSAAERVKGIFDVRWEFHTFRGDPYSGLVQAADELKADAVVVGASEQAGHRFVGSVAIRLVKAGAVAGDGGAVDGVGCAEPDGTGAARGGSRRARRPRFPG
ncbi:hypothetical protein GCM10020256_05550 [Streptomyces thermocoprophilus]